MPTPDEITAALDQLRDQLEALHDLSRQRDMLVRARTRHLDRIADLNEQIAARRAKVRDARAAAAALLEAP